MHKALGSLDKIVNLESQEVDRSALFPFYLLYMCILSFMGIELCIYYYTFACLFLLSGSSFLCEPSQEAGSLSCLRKVQYKYRKR